MSGEFGAGQDEPVIRRAAARFPKAYLVPTGVLIGLASLLTFAAVFSISRSGESAGLPPAVAGAITTPTAAAQAPAIEPSVSATPPTTAAEAVAPTPSPTAAPASTPIQTNPPTVGTPAAPSPPASALSSLGEALAQNIEGEFGVRIVREGQDWGTTTELQVRNLTGVQTALAGVPDVVRATINADTPLAFLSNHNGSTEAGWQPYGAREANYYTNEDVGPDGRVSTNQVVLQPGSNSQTIAHEIMHAYQMRSVPAGQYALALLSPEMKSFMLTTGWTQIGTDDEVRAAASGGWDVVNSLFEYDGRVLAYSNEFGDSLTLYTPNPVEAFAEAAGLYYGHNPALTLPDWAEYWDWFAANIG